ncbi:MAG: ABC transporter permease [Planctomycetes bacterium]|nr:ABC transporter permease [Planctomycetota bacterium]
MPHPLNRLLALGPNNAVALRIIKGGSSRTRHLVIRSVYLGGLMILVFFALLGPSGSLKDLAQRGASAFTLMSFGQVAAICLLTPVFMAGAIAQESNPKTWEILLTTPLSSLQIILGNLFGRLFFVFALLLATFPLFLMTQIFGGVRGSSVLASLQVSFLVAILMGSVAIALSVLRSANKRSIFTFYVVVVLFLAATTALDRVARVPTAVDSDASWTTVWTPLNPFLTLESMLLTNRYRPQDFAPNEVSSLRQLWFGDPLRAQTYLVLLVSFGLTLFAALRVRLIGSRTEVASTWLSRLLRRVNSKNERVPRHVWQNPIAWWEVSLRLSTPAARFMRWGYLIVGSLLAVVLFAMHRGGAVDTRILRIILAAVLISEVVIAVLLAAGVSATAVSREREDGSLDLLLTTPIQPGAYIAGKLRGLITVLWPMIAVPSITLVLGAFYVLTNGLGAGGVTTSELVGTGKLDVPIVLPIAAMVFPFVLSVFLAFVVMTGLGWSIKSKGVIGSTVGAIGVVMGVATTLGLCGSASGGDVALLGSAMNCLSPMNLVFAAVTPANAIPASLEAQSGLITSFLLGATMSVVLYVGITIGMHAAMKRSFMMTVRRLSGLK